MAEKSNTHKGETFRKADFCDFLVIEIILSGKLMKSVLSVAVC